MKLGRPPVGLAHVDRLEGPGELKERLRVLLATITGEMSVEEAWSAVDEGVAFPLQTSLPHEGGGIIRLGGPPYAKRLHDHR